MNLKRGDEYQVRTITVHGAYFGPCCGDYTCIVALQAEHTG